MSRGGNENHHDRAPLLRPTQLWATEAMSAACWPGTLPARLKWPCERRRPWKDRSTPSAEDDGVWQLRDGETVIATGRPASIELEHVERATFEEAVEASKRTAFTPDVHLLPTCFVCGPQRKSGDGLRLFAGPQARRGKGDKLVLAVPWVPDPTLGDKDGLVAPEFVWSALDCPSGYVFAHNPQTGGLNLTPALLGTLAVRIDGRPRLGERRGDHLGDERQGHG